MTSPSPHCCSGLSLGYTLEEPKCTRHERDQQHAETVPGSLFPFLLHSFLIPIGCLVCYKDL